MVYIWGIRTNPRTAIFETNINENSNAIEKFKVFTENDAISYVPTIKFVPLRDSAKTLTPYTFNVQMVSNNNNLFSDKNNRDVFRISIIIKTIF